MNRALAAILFLGLFLAGVSLVVLLSRHYRARGSTLGGFAMLDTAVTYSIIALAVFNGGLRRYASGNSPLALR